MKVIKIMALFAMLAALFGCGENVPQILDGPGMEYVDSEYRTAYANCLPFDEYRGAPFFAIAYLGSGQTGETNRQQYIDRIFVDLDSVARDAVKHYDHGGEHWYLVIPRYRALVSLKFAEQTEPFAYTGEAFSVRCNHDLTINVFDVTERDYLLKADENGVLENTEDIVWDITDIETVLNLQNNEKEN